MVGQLSDIQYQLEEAVGRSPGSLKPPSWYYSHNHFHPARSLRWFSFKDADGMEAAALIDTSTDYIVTLAKKPVRDELGKIN